MSNGTDPVERNYPVLIKDGVESPLLDGIDQKISTEDESRRKELLKKASKNDSKLNILNPNLSKSEISELQDLSVKKNKSMPSTCLALKRLDMTINEVFPGEEGQQLKALANRVIGYYINTNNYHSAFHACSMTIKCIKIAGILGVRDKNTIKALAVQGLYHDSGNGLFPGVEEVESPQGDEVQAALIFKRDLDEVAKRKAEEKDLGDLKVLSDFNEQTIEYPVPNSNETGQATLAEVVTVCIGSTVFRDRFADREALADTGYARIILSNFYGPEDGYSQDDINRFLDISESFIAWITRNADIAPSLEGAKAAQNSILMYGEDILKNPTPHIGQDFDDYHQGFISYLSGDFHQGEKTIMQEIAGVYTLPFPVMHEDLYGRFYKPGGMTKMGEFQEDRIEQEENFCLRIQHGHRDILLALYGVAAEEGKERRHIGDLTIKEIKERLADWQSKPIDEVTEILTQSKIKEKFPDKKSLDFNLESYPLLNDPEYQDMTIADLPATVFNRIFVPGHAEIRSDEETTALEKIKVEIDTARRVTDQTAEPHKRWEFLSKYLGGELSEEQLKLIDRCQPDETFQKRSRIDEHHMYMKIWSELREHFRYNQIIRLADSGAIDEKIAGHKRIAYKVQALIRKLLESDDRFDSTVSTGVLNLIAHAPRSCRLIQFENGARIVEQGEEPETLYLVLKGNPEFYHGAQKLELHPGDTIGSRAFFTGENLKHSVDAPENGRVLVAAFSAKDLESFYPAEEFKIQLAEQLRLKRGLPS